MDNVEERQNLAHDQIGEQQDKYFAYIYRDPNTLQVRYVGYGTRPGRAYSVGHNQKVESVIESGEDFEILIAGPYRDEAEARNIEAALVSALSPDLNLIQQPGLKFRHLGIPEQLGSRRTMESINVHDIGRMTGGALVVLCNLHTELKSGDPKLGPTNFSDDVVFANIRDYWKVKKFLSNWIADPSTSPKTLVAVQGPPRDRVVVGSSRIDSHSWKDTPVAPWDKHLHRIPLVDRDGLDVNELRGRRVDIKFGAGPANYIMWVDHTGMVLHGYRMKGLSG